MDLILYVYTYIPACANGETVAMCIYTLMYHSSYSEPQPVYSARVAHVGVLQGWVGELLLANGGVEVVAEVLATG